MTDPLNPTSLPAVLERQRQPWRDTPRRDGVCGDYLPADSMPGVPGISGACELSPDHKGMHENADRLRWAYREQEGMVIDGSRVQPSGYILGAEPGACATGRRARGSVDPDNITVADR